MMQPWFTDAKLGIFIHWGIYAVDGVVESWSFFNGPLSYTDYMKQCDGFTAANYDPSKWADLFARAGARYAVLTTKHHDGVALFDTKQSDLSVLKVTPAGQDLIGPYVEALRQQGLKVGLYFSHLDWSHPDYAPLPVGERTEATLTEDTYARCWPDGPEATAAWQRYLQFHRAQLQELSTNYGAIDLFWFDGNWAPGDTAGKDWWRMAELRDRLREWQPGAILNSRMNGYGDYETPEQAVPVTKPDGAWEFCVTMNDSWGYQGHDQNYKSVRQIVRMLAECIGMGGNLLLDIGPMPDGTIPPEQVERLEGLGDWVGKHAEAIYGTRAGLPPGHWYGSSTLTQDQETLYLFQFDRPWDEVAIKGIRNRIKRVSVIGSGTTLTHRKIGGAEWMNLPGVLWIAVPEAELDRNATVLKIELDGPLSLYSGSGHAIESN